MTYPTVSISKHPCIAIRHFENFSDIDLEGCFWNMMPADDIRENLAGFKKQGYTYYPCSCEVPLKDGSCPGWIKESEVGEDERIPYE